MNENGLTIVELVLVIVILAIMAAIVVPKFQSTIPGITLEHEARKIMAEIRKVQQNAITANNVGSVYFLKNDDSIRTAYLDDSGDEQFSNKYVLNESVDLVDTTFLTEVLRFDMLGEPSEGGDITLMNTRNESIKIHVAPSSGKVSLIQ